MHRRHFSSSFQVSQWLRRCSAGRQGNGLVQQRERTALAIGAELRLPSGDALNFLGSGAVGVKPYLAAVPPGRVLPTLELGISVERKLSASHQQRRPGTAICPDISSYYFGADIGATKRLTVIADFLGQEYFHAPQVSSANVEPFVTIPNRELNFPSVQPSSGSYAANNVAIGLKVNPWNRR